MPRSAASRSVSSNCRPGLSSLLSITSVRTVWPPKRRSSFAPHGRTGCETPSDFDVRINPQVVRWASPAGPRDAPSAEYHPPPGATAPVGGGVALASLLRCSTTATAMTPASSATAARPSSRCATAAGISVGGRLRRHHDAQPELGELRAGDLRRGTAHRVEAGLVLRESDHVAKIRLAREHHRHPVDTERYPPVRRRAHRECVEEETELRALILGAHREQVEDLRLDVGLVDPERPASELVPVHDQVIRICGCVTRIFGERLLPVVRRACERVVDGGPATFLLVPFEHREV